MDPFLFALLHLDLGMAPDYIAFFMFITFTNFYTDFRIA